jgi:hypothetical protein
MHRHGQRKKKGSKKLRTLAIDTDRVVEEEEELSRSLASSTYASTVPT